MPYAIVYLHYTETRNTDSDYDESEEDEDFEEDSYDDSERTFVEFNPTKLTVKEPTKADYIEVELDFNVNIGDTIHLVIVRDNNHRSGIIEDWCVEKAFINADEAEELVESLDDGYSNSACAEDRDNDSLALKAEVFTLTVQR